MLQSIIFIGRSGCGKGTQADLLKNRIVRLDSEKRKILYVETGDKFRKFIRGSNFSSKLSSGIYARDERQPDFLAAVMWGETLIEELDENMHLVFDGAPRSINEAKLLSNALEFYKRENPVVIYINVSRKWSEEKLLKRGRSDDVNLAKIDKRLDWFDTDVVPVVEYLQSNPLYKVLEINGEQTPEAVHHEIVAKYEYSDN